jgi:hypothetical protein
MLNFKSFLKESVNPIQQLWEELLREAKATSENDDMGKLHELRWMYHASHEDDKHKQLPEHHRSEGKEDPLHNGSPEAVHRNILSRMDPAKADLIDRGSKASADAWRKKYLKPGDKVSRVFWTSNRDQVHKKTGQPIPGDHQKTTGIHDPNSNADSLVEITRKDGTKVWHGPSLKVGKQEPNLSNPGIDSLEKMSGHEKNHFSDMETPHLNHVINKHGYSPKSREDRHAQWKIDTLATSEGPDAVRKNLEDIQKRRASGEKIELKERKYEEHGNAFLNAHDGIKSEKQKNEFLATAKHRAQSAVDSYKQVRQDIATKISDGLSKQVKIGPNGEHDDSELRNTLSRSFSPQTKIKHSIVHTKLDGKGGFESHVADQDTYASAHFNRFKNLHVSSGDGISTYIKGHLLDEKTGEVVKDKKGKPKIMNVAQINVKGNSGPMNNIVGSAKIVNKKGGDTEE